MSDVIGSASFELRAKRDKLKSDLADAERDLNGFVDGAERQAGAGGKKIAASIAGMVSAAAVGIGALVAGLAAAGAAAFSFSVAGMRMADGIANSARQIGVGTNALQEWRFVARKTGEDATAADRALDGFATKLAKAAAGTSKQAVDAFGLIGLKPGDLKKFTSVEAALDAVVGRVRALKSETDRVAAIDAMGLGPLSTALRDTTVDVDGLRAAARSLGFVMDEEMIKRASEAQGKFDDLSQVIDLQLKSAFIDLAPVLLTAIGLIAQLAQSLGDALDQWRDLETKTSRGIQRVDQRQSAEQAALIDRYGSRAAMNGQIVRARPVEGAEYRDLTARETGSALVRSAPSLPSAQPDPSLNFLERIGRNSSNLVNAPQYVDAGQHFDAINRQRVANALELQSRNQPPERSDRPAGATLSLPPGRVDRSGERAAREALRSQRAYEDDLARVQRDTLRAQSAFAVSAQDRASQAIMQLDLEREARTTELDRQEADGKINASRRQQLEEANKTFFAVEESRIAHEYERDRAEELLRAQEMIAAATEEMLGLRLSGATTEKERMKIERELLRLRQAERRAALERLAADPDADPEQRAAAGRLLGGLGERESAEDVALTRGTGPVREAGNIADGVLNEDGRESRFAAMYAEIDRLRQEDILSEEQAAQAKAEINARHEQERLAHTSQFFGDLAGLANSSNRTLAGIGRAAAIAQATIDGYLAVQKALASAPPPMNFALAAAAGAAAAANVAAIAGVGFARGGYVEGPGTETSDSIPARLSRGEFVVTAAQTKRHRTLLEAINKGMGVPGFALGGFVGATEAAGELIVPSAQMAGRSIR